MKEMPKGDEQSIIESNNLVALDLYSGLAKEGENLLISPFSILAALCMAYAGARKKTATQMESALHITIPQNEFHPVFNQFSGLLNVSEGYELAVANALSMKAEKQILDSYRNLIRSVYGGEILEFSVDAINDWVSRQTRSHIQKIVDPSSLATAVLVLINAVYFRGYWNLQFAKENTKDSDFLMLSGKVARVPLMHQTDTFRYSETHSMQILEMNFKGCQRPRKRGGVSMVVFLPKKRDGLPGLEAEITAEFVQQSIRSLRKSKVKVFLPRFSLETKYELNRTVIEMGMAEAFTPDADFSGMTADPEGLMIESIIHKATIDVDEEGTIAAAATAIRVTLGAMPPQKLIPPPIFRADHPFLFLLRDVNTGIILFIGKLMAPIGPAPKGEPNISLIRRLAGRLWPRR